MPRSSGKWVRATCLYPWRGTERSCWTKTEHSTPAAFAGGEVRNSVDAGDSMVAGFLAGYLQTGDYRYALQLGSAAGSATAFSEGLAKRDTIMEVMQKMQ